MGTATGRRTGAADGLNDMKNIFLLTFFCMSLASCSTRNDIDDVVAKKWAQCADKSNCVIDLSDSMQFEWDTLYYFSAANSLEEINEELARQATGFTDIGDRVIFMHGDRIVHHTEWFPQPSEPTKGVVFSTDSKKFKLPDSDAKFKIRKDGMAFYLEKTGSSIARTSTH
jgi:hypothetical protein